MGLHGSLQRPGPNDAAPVGRLFWQVTKENNWTIEFLWHTYFYLQYKQRSHGWCTTRPNNRGRHIKHSELAAILPSWYTFNFPHQMPNLSNNNILIKKALFEI